MGSHSFTPGPWITRRAVHPDNTGGYDVAVIAPGKAIIAECFENVGYTDDGQAFDTRPAQGNANLIAAAPELLSELQALVAAVKFADPPKVFNGVECHEARVPLAFVEGAEAAIRKALPQARGETS